MHNLVPHFIIEKLAQDERQGAFLAIGLFVDISGFTRLMETLMQHGQHGAEVMATVMCSVFEPLVQHVVEQGGFVSNFAGDAFTAFFPLSTPEARFTTAQRAITAAWHSHSYLAQYPTQETVYGRFQMAAKFGLSLGEVSWGILCNDSESQAAFYFRGTAVDGCATAEKKAQPGDIVLDAALAETVADWVAMTPRETHFVVNGRPKALSPVQEVVPPQTDLSLLKRFFPEHLLTQPFQGEFRQIVNVFIRLPENENETDLALFMQTVFHLQAQYGGVNSRLGFGDKGCTLLLFWGAPIAHETDIERALGFLLTLRKKSPFAFTAGVTYRLAHAGLIGSPLHVEFTCYSSGVNLAARFMASAPDGEIWIDEATAKRARARFELHPNGARWFKGFALAQPVFQLIERRDAAVPLFIGTLSGRTAELAQLSAFLKPIEDGRFAGALRIVGEAGIGKSRLIHHLLENHTPHTASYQVFLCQTDQIMRQSLNPLRYWLQRYFDQGNEAKDSAKKRRFEKKIEQLMASTSSARLSSELHRTRSFLGAMLDLYWPESLYAQLDPQGRFENTLIALTTLLQLESLRLPVLLIIEDIHWLDEDSRHFLSQLWLTLNAASGATYPIAIIATARPDQRDAPLDEVPWQTLQLGQLSTTELRTMAANLLGGPVSPQLESLLAHRADGNPFFTEQIVRYLQDRSLLQETAAGWSVTSEDTAVLPRDVHALLVARLDQLTLPVKNGVQHAAILGREFEVRLLMQMLGQERIDTILEEAKQAGIWAPLTEPRYLFRHALVRDAAYKMQLRSRRQALHRLVVAALEAAQSDDLTPYYGELAHHAEQANLTDKARKYLYKAGNVARDVYQNNKALDYYGRSLALTPTHDTQTRYQLLLNQEKIYRWLGKSADQEVALGTLAELAYELSDKRKQAEVLLRQARHAEQKGNYTACIEAARESVALALEVNHQQSIANAHYQLGTAHHWLGNTTRAEKRLVSALKIYRAIGDRAGEANALFDLGQIALKQGDYKRATTMQQNVLLIARALNDKHKEAFTVNSMGLLAGHQHEYQQAQTHFESALALYEEIGNRRGVGVVLNNLGTIAHMLGQYDKAKQYYERSLSLRRETGERQGEMINLNNLGEVYAKQRHFNKARAYFERCLALERELDLRFAEAITLHVYAQTLIELEELALAEENLRICLDLRRELKQAVHHLLPPRLGLIYIAHLKGEHNDAEKLLRKLLIDLASHRLDGLGDPFGFYWLAITLAEYYQNDRATDLVSEAYAQLQRQADKISDKHSRRSFLENVPEHRSISSMYRRYYPSV